MVCGIPALPSDAEEPNELLQHYTYYIIRVL
jgi:hypothetical protein